ncbi:MAG: hypothetical protein Q9184_002797 [Pyrenodesmia sp. 2 TL-2023]
MPSSAKSDPTASIATDITQANDYLQTAAQLLVPKRNCAYASMESKNLRDWILVVIARLGERAFSTAPRTKVAVTLNINAIRNAILD